MDHALYIAMSGAKQNMQALQVRANNLANANTTGFRADLEQSRSMQAYGPGLPTRVFNMTERPGNSFQQGAIVTTGRKLDVAIEGDGWISVMDDAGQEGLTRVGNLKVDQNGLLTNGSGHRILGETGDPIVVPLPVDSLTVRKDGVIQIVPKGAPATDFEEIDRIKLTRSDNRSLYKDTNGLFRFVDPTQQYEADANVSLLSGALEGSNVNAVSEMTSLIDIQRQYEMQVKMMSTAKEMDQKSDSLLSS